ncbi:glutaredoxin [Candidatus Uhrbacteria bacterium]|nr:glutaredoxin [Candidatus Uhrbacteria bacterium]
MKFFFRIFFFLMLVMGGAGLAGVHSFADTAPQEDSGVIFAFVRDDCGHCVEEKKFLDALSAEYPNLEIHYYNLAEEKNRALFTQVAEQYELVKGTPITMIRATIVHGFESAETTGAIFRDLLKKEGENKRFEDILDGGATVHGGISASCPDDGTCDTTAPSYVVRIPFIGTQIDVGTMPLFALSAVLGFIDGFNPCAMWVLVMFLLILSQVGSRKRMAQYAGLFILAEAVMYYLILTAWITAWDFIALDRIVTPAVGLLAFGSGAYFLYRFFTFKPECSIAGLDQQQSFASRAKMLASKPLTFGVVLGILGLAFSVNIFEFACSIGIPQTFTKIIELNAPNWLAWQGYMATYIMMYMIDDLVVFAIALYGINKISSTAQYAKWSSLLGGVLMILLGILMVLRPDLLIL